MSQPSAVAAVPAAPSAAALAHFEASFTFETDCWDVHDLAHGKIVAGKLAQYPAETLFVVYCAGPHCNGAARAAMRLARLGRPVKLMTGGVTGWLDEGFALAQLP